MNSSGKLRVCFVLPGLHRVRRGAETAFEAIAHELSTRFGMEVTLIGSGDPKKHVSYRYIKAPSLQREIFERWPRLPLLRNEYRWEELCFSLSLLCLYRPSDFDINVTCSYPFANWLLRTCRRNTRPRHVFVTQNGDWAPRRINAEYKFFSCDALVCTNPEYYQRHQNTWKSRLIPNGFDPVKLTPGNGDRSKFGLPNHAKIVLVVSALIPSKRVLEAVRAVARVPHAFLVVVGDGPLRSEFTVLANQLLSGRHLRTTLNPDEMPAIYQCADTLLHMGRNEAFGNIYVEALGMGLPIVAHEYSTTRWIFHSEENPPNSPSEKSTAVTGSNVWLVDTGNLEKVAVALKASLRCSRHGALTQHQQAAERFSWHTVAKQYAEFLSETAKL